MSSLQGITSGISIENNKEEEGKEKNNGIIPFLSDLLNQWIWWINKVFSFILFSFLFLDSRQHGIHAEFTFTCSYNLLTEVRHNNTVMTLFAWHSEPMSLVNNCHFETGLGSLFIHTKEDCSGPLWAGNMRNFGSDFSPCCSCLLINLIYWIRLTSVEQSLKTLLLFIDLTDFFVME